jgi:hypothetical protein
MLAPQDLSYLLGLPAAMRVFPLIVLSLALVLAGCAKKDDGGTTTTSSTPTGTTGATTSTTSTTSTTPTGTTTPTTTTPTTPMKPAPMELCKVTNDYSTMTPDPTTQTASKKGACGTVAAGYTTATLNVTFATTAPVALTQGASVKLVGADGKTAIATCTINPGDMGPIKCAKEGAVTAGDVSLLYEGFGGVTVSGTVEVK